ncbi:hypothetical protein BANRA_01543 [Klebsiella pneumoniae]|nr:hypothetical protein BANRA_01543 [Klebsiella pneumoniae]
MTTSDVIALGALAVSIYTIISSELKSRKAIENKRLLKMSKIDYVSCFWKKKQSQLSMK